MRWIVIVLIVGLALSLSGALRADENPELYLTKLIVKPAEPTKKGRHRGSVKLVATIPGYHLPRDFRFDPVATPLGVFVGGVPLFSGPGEGKWNRVSGDVWTYRQKGDTRWKMRIDLTGRGQFVIKGKKLDLTRATGPADCDVYLTFGSASLGVRTTGQEKNGKWRWVRGPGSMPSKAPGYLPPAGGGDGGPGDDDPPPQGPVRYRVIANGYVCFGPGCGSWTHGLLVTDPATWNQQWSGLLGSPTLPAIDFSREHVKLQFVSGIGFGNFSATRENGGVTIRCRIISGNGVRRRAYCAIVVEKSEGPITVKFF